MPFPIAIGTAPQSSSRPLSHTTTDNNDGTEEIVITGNNGNDSLCAYVSIRYRFYKEAADGEDDTKNNGWKRQDGTNHVDNSRNDENLHSETVENGEYIPTRDEHQSHNANTGNTHTHNNQNKHNKSITYNVLAELRIQIQSTSSSFTNTTSRETKCRVPLGRMRRRLLRNEDRDTTTVVVDPNDNTTEENDRTRKQERDITEQEVLPYQQPCPSVIFSSSNTQLACLIPFPRNYVSLPSSSSHNNHHKSCSLVVLFSITSQVIRMENRLDHLPPLPEYVLEKTFSTMETNRNITSHLNRVKKDDENSQTNLEYSNNNNNNNANLVYLAHCPKIVRLSPQQQQQSLESNATSFKNQSNPPLVSGTTLCDLPQDHTHSTSILLVGNVLGGVYLVDYGLGRVVDSWVFDGNHGNSDNNDNSQSNDKHMPQSESNKTIIHISQSPPTTWKPLDAYGEETGSLTQGRIALIHRDGTVSLYSTKFVPKTNSFRRWRSTTSLEGDDGSSRTRMEVQLNPLLFSPHPNQLRYVRSSWLNPSFLVLLTRSPNLDSNVLLGRRDAVSSSSEVVVAQSWRVGDCHRNQSDANEGNDVMLISELKRPMGDEDSMKECSHSIFSVHSPSCNVNSDTGLYDHHQLSCFVADCESSMSISYHRETDCVLLCTQSVAVGPSSQR